MTAALMLAPSIAHASPFSVGLWGLQEPTGEPTAAGEDAGDVPPPFEPTSSKAPDSAERAEPEPLPEDPVEPEPEPADTSLEEERAKAPSKGFNRHGIGVRGGIVVIPTWILSSYLDAHTNALCRGESIGSFAKDNGVLKVDGCNFYVGGEYIYRQSRILDIVASMGYQRAHTPEGYWLDKGEDLSGADYTEVELDMMYIEADFIARYPVVATEDVEFGIGGGAGIGLGILFGGIYQTPLGSVPAGFTPDGGVTPNTCQSIDDLADFTRCTPRWDPGEAQDADVLDQMPAEDDLSNPNAGLFATCTKDKCSAADLNAFGYRRKQDDVPPVIPVVNLIISTRVIIKDTFAITLSGGWNTGFYFGGGLAYLFGKQVQKKKPE